MNFFHLNLFCVLSVLLSKITSFPFFRVFPVCSRFFSVISRNLKVMSEKSFVDFSVPPPYLDILPLPSIVHKTIPEDETPKRLITVGDVHGCFDELKELLEKCDYQDPDTKVLLVGDLVNKGPKSAEVVRFAKDNNFLCIRGNHDDFILAAIMNLIPDFKRTNAIKFIDELTR